MENSFSIDLGEPLSHGIRVIDEIASLLSRKLHPCAKMMFTHQFFSPPSLFFFSPFHIFAGSFGKPELHSDIIHDFFFFLLLLFLERVDEKNTKKIFIKA